MWKRKEEKEEDKEQEQEQENLLKELCGDDTKLYYFLSQYLYLNPLSAISEKDLDILTEEAGSGGRGKIHQSYPKPRAEGHTRDRARKRKGREGGTHGPGCFPWEKN